MTQQQLETRFPHIIDNSLLKDFRSCPQKAFRNRLQGLQPLSGGSIDLHFGSAFAKGVEAARRAFFEGGCNIQAAWCCGYEAALAFYDKDRPELPLYSRKMRINLVAALKHYWDTWLLGEDGLTPIAGGIEHEFKVQLPFVHPGDGEPLYYGGRCDTVATDEAGNIVIVDEKTSGRFTDAWLSQWDMDPQTTGYIWAMGSCLDEDMSCHAQVRGVSIGADVGHMTVPVFRTQWQLNLWHKQMLRDVATMLERYDAGYWDYHMGSACTAYGRPCDYVPLCSSPNSEAMIEQNYKVEFWSPHTAKEPQP